MVSSALAEVFTRFPASRAALALPLRQAVVAQLAETREDTSATALDLATWGAAARAVCITAPEATERLAAEQAEDCGFRRRSSPSAGAAQDVVTLVSSQCPSASPSPYQDARSSGSAQSGYGSPTASTQPSS